MQEQCPPMAAEPTATCPQCSRMIAPEDTIVFHYRVLGHLDCRRPRVLSAEERTLLLIYCRDHHVAECVRCGGRFYLREVASLDSFGIRSYGCPWCHTDLTENPAAEDDGVVRQDRSRALRARLPLLFHCRHLPKMGGRQKDNTEPLLAQYDAILRPPRWRGLDAPRARDDRQRSHLIGGVSVLQFRLNSSGKRDCSCVKTCHLSYSCPEHDGLAFEVID